MFFRWQVFILIFIFLSFSSSSFCHVVTNMTLVLVVFAVIWFSWHQVDTLAASDDNFSSNFSVRVESVSVSWRATHLQDFISLRRDYTCTSNIHAQRDAQKHCFIYPHPTLNNVYFFKPSFSYYHDILFSIYHTRHQVPFILWYGNGVLAMIEWYWYEAKTMIYWECPTYYYLVCFLF